MSPKTIRKPSTKEQWEYVLRESLAEAQAEYETVKEECKSLMVVSADAERPDSSLALIQALALKRKHMEKYMAALRQFTDL